MTLPKTLVARRGRPTPARERKTNVRTSSGSSSMAPLRALATGWQLEDGGCRLRRAFRFRSQDQALGFVARIRRVAASHHAEVPAVTAEGGLLVITFVASEGRLVSEAEVAAAGELSARAERVGAR